MMFLDGLPFPHRLFLLIHLARFQLLMCMVMVFVWFKTIVLFMPENGGQIF